MIYLKKLDSDFSDLINKGYAVITIRFTDKQEMGETIKEIQELINNKNNKK